MRVKVGDIQRLHWNDKKYVLMYHIWTSFSPELYAVATAAELDEDNGDHTEKQILTYVEELSVSKPPRQKVETEETPQAGGSVIKNIRSQELLSTPNLAPGTAAMETTATHTGAKDKAKAPRVWLDLDSFSVYCCTNRSLRISPGVEGI